MTTIQLKPGVRLHILPTQQFSTTRIEINVSQNLTAEQLNGRVLSAGMLDNSSQVNPSQTAMARALSALYGAAYGVEATRQGRIHVIRFRLNLVSTAFLQHASDDLVVQGVDFLREVMFNPLGDATAGFDPTVFARQKAAALDEIAGLEEDRPYIAGRDAMAQYFDDPVQALPGYGTKEGLALTTPLEAWAAWQQALQEDQIDIVVSGAIDPEQIEALFATLPFEARQPKLNPFYNQPLKPGVRSAGRQVQPLNQTQLNLVFQLDVHEVERFAAYLLNIIFGGGPSSRLFASVREELGLAYAISSDYNNYTQTVLVSAGLEAEAVAQGRTQILGELTRLQEELVTEAELTRAKQILLNDFILGLDSQNQVVDRAYTKALTRRNLEQADWERLVAKVTPADIKRLAQKMTLQTIYTLKEGVPHA